MLKVAATGATLIVAGSVQFAHHLNRPPALADYLAFRCGAADPAAGQGPLGEVLHAAGHCWGCYAMAIGAALIAISVWRAFGARRLPSR